MAGGTPHAPSSGAAAPAPLDAFFTGGLHDAYRRFGAHPVPGGWEFLVWAPSALAVSVTGDFCAWDAGAHPLRRAENGLWRGFVPNLRQYDTYKYSILTRDARRLLKADPFAFHAETRPATASKLYDLAGYEWGDGAWLAHRRAAAPGCSPMAVYECHAGSWRRNCEHFFSYSMLADALIPYVKALGFTHIELLPLAEHPLDASWGYQTTGYFAPTSRFGTPHDLMGFVDRCHRAGLGVIMDWTPAHFCPDEHGLIEFDGGALYEYSDPLKREHKGWGTRVFDYGRGEVRSFLISSALLWLREYHMDGLRVDACASMLYLDYGRREGEWRPNACGGAENLEAVSFLRELNAAVAAFDPSAVTAAEESTAWPGVTSPEGLGFGLKWNMGWMNDLLRYMRLDPLWRGEHHGGLNFSLHYAFSERYILPLSHDEVVHMKGSLSGKMPGTRRQRLQNLRLLLAWQCAHPGKKLLFMGAELGQENEWHFEGELDWFLLDDPEHRAVFDFLRGLNLFYLRSPALWAEDFAAGGFQWLDGGGRERPTSAFFRLGGGQRLLCAFNFAGIPYKQALPPGSWRVVLSTGGGAVCGGELALPALGAVFLEEGENE